MSEPITNPFPPPAAQGPIETPPGAACCLGAPCRQWIYRWACRRLSSPDDAEDLLQEVCLRCLRGQPAFRGQAPFPAWLRRVMRNAYRDFLRQELQRKGATKAEPPGGASERAVAPRPSGAAAAAGDRITGTRAALRPLRPRQRRLLELRYFAGYTHAEIAAELGVTEGSARVMLHRAQLAFKTSFERLADEQA